LATIIRVKCELGGSPTLTNYTTGGNCIEREGLTKGECGVVPMGGATSHLKKQSAGGLQGVNATVKEGAK